MHSRLRDWCVLLAVPLFSTCLQATQVSFEITTDVPCEQLNGIAITVGTQGQTERAASITDSKRCSREGTVSIIGTYALYPKRAAVTGASLKVVAAIGPDVNLLADCTPEKNYQGCIVVRRRVTFSPHQSLVVPLHLIAACKNQSCDENSTCSSSGACVTDEVDTSNCDETNRCEGLVGVKPQPSDAGRPVDAGLDAGAGVDAGVDAGATFSRQAYVKATSPDIGDLFGKSAVALSDDGSTMVVGSAYEDSSATGINGDQTRNNLTNAGAAWVFVRTGTSWAQQAYLKASNAGLNHQFGVSVAIASDGNTVAVGADGESSNATGVDGNQSDTSEPGAGAVYVFTRTAGTWSQQAYLKNFRASARTGFGTALALSGTGDRLVVNEATGGEIFIFTRTGTTWATTSRHQPGQGGAGRAVSISRDGLTIAASAIDDSSNATGINGNPADLSKPSSGAVFTFTFDGSQWQPDTYFKASNTDANDRFGWSTALSADGKTLAVGAYRESSNATGVDGNQADNSLNNAGAVYVFQKTGAVWAQQAYLKASNPDAEDVFGFTTSISNDGNTLVGAAIHEQSCTHDIDGVQSDNTCNYAGAVYLFERRSGSWSASTYLKASNADQGSDQFGFGLSLAGDSKTLAISSPYDDAVSTGINGLDNNDPTVSTNTGAVFVFTR